VCELVVSQMDIVALTDGMRRMHTPVTYGPVTRSLIRCEIHYLVQVQLLPTIVNFDRGTQTLHNKVKETW